MTVISLWAAKFNIIYTVTTVNYVQVDFAVVYVIDYCKWNFNAVGSWPSLGKGIKFKLISVNIVIKKLCLNKFLIQ